MEFLNKILEKDEEYQENIQAVKQAEMIYEKLPLNDEYRMIIEEYISCIDAAHKRKCKIAYIAGLFEYIE